MTADRRPNLGLSGAASPRSVGPWADYRMFLIFDYYGVLFTRRTDSVYLVYFLLLSFLTFIWRTEDRRQPQNCRNAESSRISIGIISEYMIDSLFPRNNHRDQDNGL